MIEVALTFKNPLKPFKLVKKAAKNCGKIY